MTQPENTDRRPGPARTPRCPICGKPTVQDFRPFCSRRCKDVDLSRWLGGDYRIAGQGTYDDRPPDDEGA